MQQTNSNYDASSVKVLKGLEGVRQSPGMYIGSVDQKGLHHCVKEQISNGVDEYLNGSCTDIWITLHKDGSTTVKDNGRGIPHGLKEDGLSILSTCFGVLHAGGKFDNAGNSGYNTSGGEHGIGAKACSALAKKLIVTSCREGLKDTSIFEKGILIEQKTNEKIDSKEHGVEVKWYPDMTIFTEEFNSELLEKELVREFSYLNSGLHFHFKDENKNYEKDYYSEDGMRDYLLYLNQNKDFVFNPIYLTSTEDKFSIDIAIAYNSTYSSTIRLYTNSIPQEKGTHLTGFKTAWTMAINNFAKENKWLKEKDTNLTGTDLEEGMILIINFKMIDPMFEGQNKSNLTSSEGRTYTQRLVTNVIKDYLIQNKNGIKLLVEKAINARKAREAAKKARDNIRKKTEKKTVLKLPSKLTDAWGKDRSRCEIFITEGDSASGGIKESRDNETQAVLPVRGKILNVWKSSLDKILANAEIRDMIKAFGFDIDVKTGKVVFDESKLRYGKIIICADADCDGGHIQSLFYTFIWSFIPELIQKGYVYATVPPLFRVTSGKKYIYLKDEVALEEYKNQHSGKKFLVNRLKGLGEMDAEELAETIIDAENRIIKQITVEDAKKATDLFEQLMGSSAELRKQYIIEHAGEVEYFE